MIQMFFAWKWLFKILLKCLSKDGVGPGSLNSHLDDPEVAAQGTFGMAALSA